MRVPNKDIIDRLYATAVPRPPYNRRASSCYQTRSYSYYLYLNYYLLGGHDRILRVSRFDKCSSDQICVIRKLLNSDYAREFQY